MRSVVIWGYANFKWLWVPLARELKRQHGATIHFLCIAPESVAYWKHQDSDGIIGTFTTINHFFYEYDRCDDSFKDIVARAREYEQAYDTYIVDILQTDRHLGRGFAAGGMGHIRSQLSDKATYVKSVNFCNNACQFWEHYFDQTKPDLILGVVSGVVGKTCAVVARKRSIPIRVLMQSRYKSYATWGVDEYYSQPVLEETYNRLQDTYQEYVKDEELAALQRLPFTETYYQEAGKYRSVISLIRRIGIHCRGAVYRKYKGIVTIGNYKLFDKIRHAWREFRDLRFLERKAWRDLRFLDNKLYIVFPLHVEPESSLGTISPEMNEQLAIIELLAKNLPAGALLVIKEHLAALGSRSPGFYSTILEIPNVVMVSPYVYLLDIARRARAVATITGTLGAEAAMLGIPVISFGLHNEFNFVPHVQVVTSWTELRPLLLKLCNEGTLKERKRREEDGKRYLAAIKTSSIDLSWTNYFSNDRPSATEKEAGVIYESLLKSLNY